MSSLIGLWVSEEAGAVDVQVLVAEAELRGALYTLLALERTVRGFEGKTISKEELLELLGWMESELLIGLGELASEIWPYVEAEWIRKMLKEEARAAPAPVQAEAQAQARR